MTDYRNIYANKGMTYVSYRKMIGELLAEGKTTGADQSEAMLHYAKMNVQRMNRVEKTTVLNEELVEVVKELKGKYHLLVITEGWCGDAAQIVPVIQQLVSAAPDQLELKLVLRDENLDVMDEHLTNGGRAIPVLLVLDEAYRLVLPKWGPRPLVLQQLLAEWKKENADYSFVAEKLHGWYAKDRTVSTQKELIEFFKTIPV